MRNNLMARHACHCVLQDGKVLYIAKVMMFGVPQRDVMVGYQEGGFIVYDGTRPLNKFRLIQKGFPFGVAELIADLLNDIFGVQEENVVKQIEGEKHD